MDFVLGSMRRRKLILFSVLLFGIGTSYLVYWLMPRSYHVEIQLYAQRNTVLTNTVGQGDQGSPTRAAAETVLRRDNMVALVQKADLLADWDKSRSHAAQIKDAIRAKLGRFTSEQDKLDMILGTLEDKLTVNTKTDMSGEGTVTIAIDWPDPRMGYRLVTAAHQSFLEARHLSEITGISEALSILIARANAIGQEIESTAKSIEDRRTELLGKKRQAADAGERRPTRLSLPSEPAASSSGDKETTVALQAQWEAKKSAIKDLEDMRRKRIAELQTHLAELRAVYADSHPSIVDTVQTIETLSQESPQLLALRKEEAGLHSQLLALAAKPIDTGDGLTPRIPRTAGSFRAAAEPSTTDDREMQFAKAQLRVRSDTYDQLLSRIESARMEMEAVRAAFKYRYTVLRPAQIPRQPDKPNPKKIVGGGIAATLLAAILAAVIADLRTGRVYASWQLERALRLPVLAELRRDRSA